MKIGLFIVIGISIYYGEYIQVVVWVWLDLYRKLVYYLVFQMMVLEKNFSGWFQRKILDINIKKKFFRFYVELRLLEV